MTEVDFPRVFCPARLGTSSLDDRLLYPLHDGGIVVDPYQKMMGRSLGSTYPGPLSCQVMAFYDPRRRSGHGEPGPHRRGQTPVGQRRHEPELGRDAVAAGDAGPGRGGGSARRSGTFKGTWHDAAEVYRKWAQQQSFCATPLHQSPLWPTKFRQGAMVNYFSPDREDQDKKPKYSLENLNHILPELEARCGLPMITISWGWEQHGMWCSQEYFPAFPSNEDFRARAAFSIATARAWSCCLATVGRLKSPGHRGGRTTGPSDSTGKSSPGSPAADSATPTIVEPAGKESYKGSKYATLCRATQFTSDTISAIAQRVQSGYTIIHWDQVTSGARARPTASRPTTAIRRDTVAGSTRRLSSYSSGCVRTAVS